MKISLVIPVYNESRIISDTIEAARSYLAGTCEDYELVIVDDGSTDGTGDIAANHENVRLVGYNQNKGKGYAVKTGMLAAQGDFVFYTDADLAYGLEVIGAALDLFDETGADIVIGSRKLEADGYSDYTLLRRIASKCFSFAAKLCSKMDYDTQCGFKGFRKAASDAVFTRCSTDGWAFDFEVMMYADKLGHTVRQMPVRIINHRESKVRMVRDSIKMLRDILAIRRTLSKEELR